MNKINLSDYFVIDGEVKNRLQTYAEAFSEQDVHGVFYIPGYAVIRENGVPVIQDGNWTVTFVPTMEEDIRKCVDIVDSLPLSICTGIAVSSASDWDSPAYTDIREEECSYVV